MPLRAMWAILVLVLGGHGTVPGAALPPPTRYVADYADVFDAAREDELNGLLQQLQTRTGVQYIILTVRSSKGLTIEQYARRLAQLWKPQHDADKTVLFALATQQNACCFEVGRDLKGFLTERYFAQTGRDALGSRLQAEGTGESVYRYNLRVIERVAREYGVRLSDLSQASGRVVGGRVPVPGKSPWSRWGVLWLAGVFGTLLFIWVRRHARRSWRAWPGPVGSGQAACTGLYNCYGGAAFGGGFGAFGAGHGQPGPIGKDDAR